MEKLFLSTYQNLNKENLDTLQKIYAQDVFFQDPLHKVKGLPNLQAYFTKLYQNVDSIFFSYEKVIPHSNGTSIYWTMTYCHPKINKNKSVTIQGNTLIQFNEQGLVSYHRDYFDAGEMLYENLPMIGYLIRYLKNKITKPSS